MSQQCSQCKTDNQDAARFCQTCGSTLAATSLDGRTAVAAADEGGLGVAPFDIREITQKAETAVGLAPVNGSAFTQEQMAQRELTAVAIDVSGSMTMAYDGRYKKIDAAVRAETSMLLYKGKIDPLDEMAIITFNHAAYVHCGLCAIGANKRELIKILQSLRAD